MRQNISIELQRLLLRAGRWAGIFGGGGADEN